MVNGTIRHPKGGLRMRKTFKIVIVILLLALLASTTATFGNEIDQINRQLKELQDQRKDLSAELKQIGSQKRDVSAELQNLSTAITNAENEISTLHSLIQEAEKNIARTEDDLTLATMHINEKKDLLARRLDAMYRNGNIAYAEVLFLSISPLKAETFMM